jgi:lysophospholipase L1-like esterase
VIILAGNNDVFTLEQDLTQSIENLKKIYNLFNGTDTKRWVLTLPCHQGEHEIIPYKERRIVYNAELKKVIPANDILHFDAWNDTQVNNKELYVDPIHFSPLGYEAFGEYIYENIKGNIADSAVQSRL